MKFLILIAVFLSLILSGCTQTSLLKNALAYSMQISTGAPPKYKNGVAINRSYTMKFIYFESTKVKPIIKELIYNGTLINGTEVFLAGNTTVEIGTNKSDGMPIKLSPSKGNSIWRIEFRTTENQEEKNSTAAKSNILIIGKINGKPFSIKINSQIELKPFIGY